MSASSGESPLGIKSLLEEREFYSDRPGMKLLHDSEAMRVVLFTFEPGQEKEVHSSPSRVLMLALEGSGTFTLAEGERAVRAGDLAICEPNEPHGMKASGGERLTLLAVIAPRPG
ncbi:MAG: cupin domain-containing protein [Nitrospinota bacterium]